MVLTFAPNENSLPTPILKQVDHDDDTGEELEVPEVEDDHSPNSSISLEERTTAQVSSL